MPNQKLVRLRINDWILRDSLVTIIFVSLMSTSYFCSMKIYPYLLFIVIIFGCSSKNSEKAQLDNIKILEANKNLATSDTLIHSYINFANQYPQHPYAIKFLFKAAEASVKAKRNAEGARLYEQVANTYKDSTILASEALIRAGFNYEVLGDPANEKRVFEQFLNQYPTHPRVMDIKMTLELVGYSREMQDSILMERIRKNNPEMDIDQ